MKKEADITCLYCLKTGDSNWAETHQCKEEQRTVGIKRFAERLKWYVNNLKTAEGEIQKNSAIASIIGYLEGFIEFYDN